MGPFWDGNEVWLITAGGVTFAAFPTTYAAMFSGLYSALMLILFALIIRGVSFAFRDEVDSPGLESLLGHLPDHRQFPARAAAGSGLCQHLSRPPHRPGRHLPGHPVYPPQSLRAGGAASLRPALSGPRLPVAGGQIRGRAAARAAELAPKLWAGLLVMAVVFLLATRRATFLYDNYVNHPVLFLIPAITVAALILIRVFIARAAWWRAWFASCLTIVGVTLFGVVGLYPNLLPSSMDPAYSLTVFNSASSPLTLKIMLAVALTFVPIVIAYQVWVHYLFKDKVKRRIWRRGIEPFPVL